MVAELQQRSKQVAFEAAALTSQRQQLAALDAQRRAAIRAIEDSLATAGARLDDRAKEEKLRQIRLAEEAYQVTAHVQRTGVCRRCSIVGTILVLTRRCVLTQAVSYAAAVFLSCYAIESEVDMGRPLICVYVRLQPAGKPCFPAS